MQIRFLFYLLITGFASFINFFVCKSLVSSLAIFIFGLIILILFVDKTISNFLKKENKVRECVMFINNFIITLSINRSISSTYNIIQESFSKSLKNQVKMLTHLSEEEQVFYLEKYFNLNIYQIFLNLLKQYIYNGGDILKIAQILLFDVRTIEENLDTHISILVKKIAEFLSLWGMSFLIVIIIKLSLNSFLGEVLTSNIFIYGLSAFFALFFINIVIFILHGFNMDFIKVAKKEEIKKRGSKNEKNKKRNRIPKQKLQKRNH